MLVLLEGNAQYGQQQEAYQQGPPQQQGYPPQQQYPGQQGYPPQQQGYGKFHTFTFRRHICPLGGTVGFLITFFPPQLCFYKGFKLTIQIHFKMFSEFIQRWR